MDSIRPQGSSRMADIQSSESSQTRPMPRLEEEYSEWFTVSPDDMEGGSQEVFVPPVFEYTPKKKRKPVRSHRPFLVGVLTLGVLLAILVVGSGLFLWLSRDVIEHSAEEGFLSLEKAKAALINEEYNEADSQFRQAKISFEEANGAIPFWTRPILRATAYIPGLSRGASAENILVAGTHIAEAGPAFVEMADGLARTKESIEAGKAFSLLQFFDENKVPLAKARSELILAEKALSKVKQTDVPLEKRKSFILAQEQLPAFLGIIDTLESHEAVIQELLGSNGPRKYLFLLENNHELRATGGFIGSYALLEMQDGVVKNFFVDGIFNPDGQLRENIVPPKPLQKVSAGWSLHDSNWFPDFPTSAEKAIFFYEKTGGPTVDGVVVITPTLTQKLLALTGPIALPQYNLTVTADNFFPVIQEEVEINYDKKENKPKAVLADLSTVLFERLLHSRDEKVVFGTLKTVIESLNQKQMMLYVRDDRVEKIISQAGWSGEIRPSDKDYLNVIHSNINGYKTDGVIEDSIKQNVEIAPDGSIIDTVRITRRHTGGKTPYDWWNRVNANYMRVYVPLGSELISAEGHTYEFPESPLDYDALGFKRDKTVTAIESTERIDEESGTRISEESGKTVFGNWVYVSPQEEVTVEYRYKLPFKLAPGGDTVGTSSYSLLIQKQAGTPGAAVAVEVSYPESFQPIWQTGRNLVPYEHTFRLNEKLVTDLFLGVAFDKP
ncbi:MAG: DUF4012 domain-containing protein [Patescibacteria group bacterium]